MLCDNEALLIKFGEKENGDTTIYSGNFSFYYEEVGAFILIQVRTLNVCNIFTHSQTYKQATVKHKKRNTTQRYIPACGLREKNSRIGSQSIRNYQYIITGNGYWKNIKIEYDKYGSKIDYKCLKNLKNEKKCEK